MQYSAKCHLLCKSKKETIRSIQNVEQYTKQYYTLKNKCYEKMEKAKGSCSKLMRPERKSNAACVPGVCPGLGKKGHKRHIWGQLEAFLNFIEDILKRVLFFARCKNGIVIYMRMPLFLEDICCKFRVKVSCCI